jgi:integrase
VADLSAVKSREKLKYQREPYWQKLAGGQYIGYRTSTGGKGGMWHARFYDADANKQRRHPLGDFGHLPAHERFAAASQEARDWFKHIAGGGSHACVTVGDACRAYASTRPDAERRFNRYVYSDPIAAVKLHKLTERHVREWRSRLERQPAIVSKPRAKPQVTRVRAAATLNRDMVPFRAALNLALGQGDVMSARAWTKALEPVEARGRRNLYLDKHQRRGLLDHLPAAACRFVTGLCSLPLRPGALAALTVGDFDPRRNELAIGRDKSNAGRKLLLPKQTALFLSESAGGRAAEEPLFIQDNGLAWSKDAWKKPIKVAASLAGLPSSTTAYTLRHSTITDLIQSGLNLLAVAQLSGTSVRMIERHYGHLQRESAAEALAGLTL